MRSKLGFILILALSTFVLATNCVNAAESANLRKVRMAFTSLSSVMCPPWIAREIGIFNKHSLDVEVIATPTGVEGMNALIAGEVHCKSPAAPPPARRWAAPMSWSSARRSTCWCKT